LHYSKKGIKVKALRKPYKDKALSGMENRKIINCSKLGIKVK
jgi:predicted hydrolase (HD superfamily)